MATITDYCQKHGGKLLLGFRIKLLNNSSASWQHLIIFLFPTQCGAQINMGYFSASKSSFCVSLSSTAFQDSPFSVVSLSLSPTGSLCTPFPDWFLSSHDNGCEEGSDWLLESTNELCSSGDEDVESACCTVTGLARADSSGVLGGVLVGEMS